MFQATEQKYQVPSVDSACHILRFACESKKPLSISEITGAANASRTTTIRIVSSLCHNGFLRRDEQGMYSVGDALRLLGSQMDSGSTLRQKAVPILKELAEIIGETTHFAIPLQSHCLLQEVVDSPELVRVASRPGTLIDYHCSVTGKAILAFRNDLLEQQRETLQFIKRTKNTITNWSDFESSLQNVRAKGYAVDEEEYHLGVRCVGAPIYDSSGQVVAAIGVTGTTSRFTKRRIPAVSKLVISAAERLSHFA